MGILESRVRLIIFKMIYPGCLSTGWVVYCSYVVEFVFWFIVNALFMNFRWNGSYVVDWDRMVHFV